MGQAYNEDPRPGSCFLTYHGVWLIYYASPAGPSSAASSSVSVAPLRLPPSSLHLTAPPTMPERKTPAVAALELLILSIISRFDKPAYFIKLQTSNSKLQTPNFKLSLPVPGRGSWMLIFEKRAGSKCRVAWRPRDKQRTTFEGVQRRANVCESLMPKRSALLKPLFRNIGISWFR